MQLVKSLDCFRKPLEQSGFRRSIKRAKKTRPRGRAESRWWRVRKEKARTQIKLKKRRNPPFNGSTKTRFLVYVIFDYFPLSRQKGCLAIYARAIQREPSSHMHINYSTILERY